MNYCTIDHNIRKIRVPISEKILGVVGDKDIKRRYFKVPRYYEGNDLSKFDIKINYVNEDCDKNMYVVDDVQTEDDYITFSWLIEAGVCRVPGDVGYVVCMRLVDEDGNVVKEYNTELTIGTVLDGCEADSTEVEEETKDIVAQFMRYLDDVKGDVVNVKNAAETAATAATTATDKANEASTYASDAKSSSGSAKENADLVSANKIEIDNMKSDVESKVEQFESDLETYSVRTLRSDMTELQKETSDGFSELKSDLANSKEAIADLDDKKITKFYANSLGETTLNDSDNGKIQDMILYGKSEQFSGDIELEDGTTVTVPCPDYPQEIKSVVNPKFLIYGNLYNKNTKRAGYLYVENIGFMKNELWDISDYIEILHNKNICFSNEKPIATQLAVWIFDENKKLLNYFMSNWGHMQKIILKTPETAKYALVGYRNDSDVQDLMLNYGTKRLTYSEYKEPQLVTLPYTLNAIPVSSGGNVTIDGQQYIADYVDVERGKLVRIVDSSKLDNTQSIIDKTEWLLAETQEIDLTTEEITAFKALETYYPTTNISVNSKQLDGYIIFNYPISMQNGWNYVKQQIGDAREYIYDMDLQSAEAYVNSEYAVALTELEV